MIDLPSSFANYFQFSNLPNINPANHSYYTVRVTVGAHMALTIDHDKCTYVAISNLVQASR